MFKKVLAILVLIIGMFLVTSPSWAGEKVNKVNGNLPVHEAALKGDIAKVKSFLKKDANLLESNGRHDKKPLHWAAESGNVELVKFLLSKGAAIDSKNSAKETPLIYAVARDHLDVAQFLVAKGADINVETQFGTPLSTALGFGKPEIAKFLVQKGADVNYTREGNVTLMHLVAWGSKKEMAQLLIQKGAKATVASDDGRTPLHDTGATGNTGVAAVLIDNGADVNAQTKQGVTPLFEAARKGHTDVTALLLKAGANPDIFQETSKCTPLHIAAMSGFGKVTAMLLEKGADWKTTDTFGNTPLDYAARYGHKKVAKVLLSKGAEVKDMEKFKKHFGFTPLKKEFKPQSAVVWYTGHSGWAIKTQNNLLIFDYWKNGKLPDTPGMANGTIDPAEIKDMKVTVFVSHEHDDHFMPAIFDWKKDVKDITYVMGFKPEKSPGEFVYMGPREKKGINGMKVLTIKSNDSGVGFYVIADGVQIYHPGDHANRKKDFSGPFKKEIDYLAGMGLKPDISFAPVSGCGFGDLEAVKKGVYYTVKKLGAKSVFPMHSVGDPFRYVKFAKVAKKDGFDIPFCCAANSGDWFYVNQGEVKKMYSLFHHSKKKKEKGKKLAVADTAKSCDKKTKSCNQ